MARPSLYAGCSGWAYASWKPGFYPAKTAAKQFLAYYASQLNSVEVNYTFRQLPSEAQAENWLAATAEDFRFSFKAPQRVSHLLRLRNCDEAMTAFADSLAPFKQAGRMGLVLVQLPPNFKADATRLESFLEDASRLNLRLALEFRHESWFEAATYATLERHGAALCIAESDELVTPEVHTAAFGCYRLRRSHYDEAALNELAERLHTRAASGEVYAYFKHEEAPDGPLRARAVLDRLQQL
uniref:DUF72 domain-containing protein n=1 Tax=Acidobacterium capsulatum TaxID=33075 RepID=A0A7V5CSQ2_9BACT